VSWTDLSRPFSRLFLDALPREEWLIPPRAESLDDPRGHPANQAGLEVDDLFRPIGKDGGPVFDNLFACGSILAHQDWMRMKCGSGLAIGTALAAVDAFSSFNA